VCEPRRAEHGNDGATSFSYGQHIPGCCYLVLRNPFRDNGLLRRVIAAFCEPNCYSANHKQHRCSRIVLERRNAEKGGSAPYKHSSGKHHLPAHFRSTVTSKHLAQRVPKIKASENPLLPRQTVLHHVQRGYRDVGPAQVQGHVAEEQQKYNHSSPPPLWGGGCGWREASVGYTAVTDIRRILHRQPL